MLYGKGWDQLQCRPLQKKRGKMLQQNTSKCGIFQIALGPSTASILISSALLMLSIYYNYKGSNSIVLLALVDADYKFIAIDIGSYGRNSDGGIFSKSAIGKKLHSKTFNVPEPTPIVENGNPEPYVVVGDEAFSLKTYLLRPYSRHHLGDN